MRYEVSVRMKIHVVFWTVETRNLVRGRQWRTGGGGLAGSTPPPEIPKALQNRAKLSPIVKPVKNC